MRRILIYIFAISLSFNFLTCSDHYEEATSKHVYGEDENPYLRVDQEATITTNIEFAVERLEPYVVSLDDHNELFQEKMGMTVEQVISGLNNGSVVFYNINTTRNHWNKSGKTKGNTGWYYNTAGGVTTESDNAKTASLDIDTNNKTLIVTPIENVAVGTSVAFNVGFAVNGDDYDDYVRFSFQVSYTDPTIVMLNITIPAGDYASYGIDLNNYAETIALCMEMTVEEFLANMDTNGGKIRMYAVNPQSGEWDETSSYTANAPGYWMNNSGAVCNWGDTGFTVFAELNTDDQLLYIGRAPELTAGNKYAISIGYRNMESVNYFFRFIIGVTLA
ncbi:DUF4859 domain-containing protein [Proteiniphilum sp. X52]|uniref:DUF4859 domain-containing protein n=1 Tax=Proteiniphilum sp. X52 TaxID=2382159 RepID=UPI000F0A1DAA|nr:DUF4859 domain-containing protein [Proteiniphilum sp. X52]RNC64112.1 DUF4859 domain-containing protein [Proteiniphilum sp. X52]